MKKSKKDKLQKAGWKIGDTREFLKLSDEEIALINIKQKLMQLVRKTREDQKLTQLALAKLLESSQSRIAKLESCSANISLDLIVRALLVMGVSNRKVGQVIGS
jgi:predicted XRE-type DNA-binding protein